MAYKYSKLNIASSLLANVFFFVSFTCAIVRCNRRNFPFSLSVRSGIAYSSLSLPLFNENARLIANLENRMRKSYVSELCVHKYFFHCKTTIVGESSCSDGKNVKNNSMRYRLLCWEKWQKNRTKQKWTSKENKPGGERKKSVQQNLAFNTNP